MNELDAITSLADQMNAVPVMGAWLQAVLAAAPLVGKILGGITGGRSQGRATEIGVTQDQDAAALDRARLAEQQAARQQRDRYDEAGLDLDRREYTDKSRSQGYDDRLRGGLLEGLQDFSVEAPEGVPVGKISGGLRPSAMIGKEALGREMARSAIQRNIDGPRFSAIERVNGPQVPNLSQLPKAGKLDSFLNIAGLIANLAGGAGEVMNAVRGSGGAPASTPNAAAGQTRRIFGKARF